MTQKPSYEMLEKKIARLEAKLALFEALKEEQKVNHVFLRTLFDIIPSPMFYKDINGIYQYCNDAFSNTILGIAKETITGKSLYDLPELIPKKNADIYYQKDAELLKTAAQQSYEAKVQCADGIERHYHFYKSTLVVDNKIIGLVGVMLDVSQYKNTLTELDKINAALNRVSITDWLTGLYNRRYFENIFEQKITSLSRCKQPFYFALMDIDFFKPYNDTYGHAAGDLALQRISATIRQTISRKNDYIFRVGGEEFALLFECNSSQDAKHLLDKLKMKIENLQIRAANTQVSPYLTISIGLGNIKSINSNTERSIIYNEVDQLLYRSKMRGKNKITAKEFAAKESLV